VTDSEKYQLNLLLSPETHGFIDKRKSIEEHGTEEERALLAEWIKCEKARKAQESGHELLNDIARPILALVFLGAVWAAISILRYMWSHPIFR
jgi:hypothetical protein